MNSPWSTLSSVCAGSKGLRVADASIMPTVTTGNTNAPAVMIGERAADFLAAPHGSSRRQTTPAP